MNPPEQDHGLGLRSMMLALSGYGLFAISDGIAKLVTGHYPGTALACLRHLFAAVGIAIILWLREGRAGFTFPLWRMQLARGAAIALSTVSVFVGLRYMPLAASTMIQFASPLMLVMISALFLGERAPRVTWPASLLAIIGIALVIKPELSNVGWAGLWPLVSALCLAFLVLFNRMAVGHASALQMQLLGSGCALPFTLIAALVGDVSGAEGLHLVWPSLGIVLTACAIAVVATGGQILLFMATERTSAAHIAPFMYFQMLVAIVFGVLVFGTWPDALAMLGASLIVAAGLLLWHNSRRPALADAIAETSHV
ncbi:DMT family transporter [Sphingomonas crocodyli]|uniref:DMT family transporter n=1 Tax=Sphingomonas crocodyli TaxID=1979270 RepID=A0A437MA26_9SPHN|nr:DMT family transporter [Sphingomonas crocodyli]RVT94478.1 DMT family transporter [Sphingomonas crocodyli]